MQRILVHSRTITRNSPCHDFFSRYRTADPQFVEKLEDMVGFYLSPPENAVGVCVDETSSMPLLAPLGQTGTALPVAPDESIRE